MTMQWYRDRREWKLTMQSEIESLRQQGMWRLVPRSAARGNLVITNKWVATVKKDALGRVARFKARLVVRRFKQRYEINYYETFAPVMRFETVRVVVYNALSRQWKILQYDVKTAFLHGKLDELVYMKQPRGYVSGDNNICHFIKSFYGLKQATSLESHVPWLAGEALESDHGLYALRCHSDVVALITVYVDTCAWTYASLRDDFQLTELGHVKYLLGMEITIDQTTLTVSSSQHQYIVDVLKRFGMVDANECATTAAVGAVQPSKPNQSQEAMPYRELVDALQYLVAGTRPDIAFCVRQLGQHLNTYGVAEFTKAKRVLRYLRGTMHEGLVTEIATREPD